MIAPRRTLAVVACAAFSCVFGLATAGCQESAVDSAQETCRFDPTGELAFTVDGEAFALRFPELRWPRVGSWLLPDKPTLAADRPILCRRTGDVLEPIGGVTLEIQRFDPERITLRASWNSPPSERAIALDAAVVTARREAPRVRGPIPGMEREVPGVAEPEDYVLLIVGAAGSGWQGQARVAESIAKLVAVEAPDQVVFLGDLLAPDGPKAATDNAWAESVRSLYGSLSSHSPIPLVPGAAEHRGDMEVLYGLDPKSSPIVVDRWFRRIESKAHDVPVELLLADSVIASDSARRAEVRRARSSIAAALTSACDGWRVVASFDPLLSFGDAGETPRALEFQRTHRPMLARAQPDLWISAASRSLELVRDEHGVLHVGAGGGTGDELARDITWSGRTLFAAARGGTVWIRLGSQRGEIVFRGETGDVLHVHRFERVVR